MAASYRRGVFYFPKKLFILNIPYDKGKPVERQGRKAKGPVKWQPDIENRVFLFPKKAHLKHFKR